MKANSNDAFWEKAPQTGSLKLPANSKHPPSRNVPENRRTKGNEQPDAFWNVDLQQVLNAPSGYAYEISLDVFFNARHAVVSDGTRGMVHAHSYRLTATFQAEILSEKETFAVGYQPLRDIIKKVAAAYNNTLLNDLPPFQNIQPTTEALSAIIYQQIRGLLTDLPVELERVTVYESPTEAVSFQRTGTKDPADVHTSTTETVTFQRKN